MNVVVNNSCKLYVFFLAKAISAHKWCAYLVTGIIHHVYFISSVCFLNHVKLPAIRSVCFDHTIHNFLRPNHLFGYIAQTNTLLYIILEIWKKQCFVTSQRLANQVQRIWAISGFSNLKLVEIEKSIKNEKKTQ